MSDLERARRAVTDRVLTGEGRAASSQRRAAYDNDQQALAEPVRALIDKVACHAYRVTDEDIAAAKAAGLGDDELFELVICAALGQAQRQLDAAHAALAATKAAKGT